MKFNISSAERNLCRIVRQFSTLCEVCGKLGTSPEPCRALLAQTTEKSLLRDTRKNMQKEKRLALEISPDACTCPICDEKFHNRMLVRDHVYAVHGISLPVECVLCSRKFLNSDRLKTHMLNKHGNEMQNLKENLAKCLFLRSMLSSSGVGRGRTNTTEVFTTRPPLALPRIATAGIPLSTGKSAPSAKHFDAAELLSATNNFNEDNYLGEGSFGSVYTAKFKSGQIFVVKNINMVPLSFQEEDLFLDVVCCISHLKHPNIVPLVGYSVENGQHLLVYELVGNLTLDKALHCKFFSSLTWDIRIQIAVGVAQALDYMHSLSPPVAHCNLKAANVMLDDYLRPRVCDSGLSVLRPLSSNSCEVKAAEMAISDSGNIALEPGQTGIENIKTDVYAFGVLLLELLTGRRPFDSSRPTAEQCLVKWASNRLHDYGSLEEIVDPLLKRPVPAKALSRCAEIISLCVQPEKEFRPRMSVIAEALTIILPKPGTESV